MVDGDKNGVRESAGVEDISGFVKCGLWSVNVTVGDVDNSARAEDKSDRSRG